MSKFPKNNLLDSFQGQPRGFREIEQKWRKIWLEKKIYEPDLTLRQGFGGERFDRPELAIEGLTAEGLSRTAQGKKAIKPFYNLMMFPYPSADGLHVGNMYAFTGSDIYGRFKRMQGYDVFEPIGLDGFGIHSENYALKIGAHPAKQAKISEKRFYNQLQMIGDGFAWEERLETYNPQYYRWTQWIFAQMFKRGLAYRKKQAVNWCPSCKTVLADEQVINGECERCGSKVLKKNLEQWFFRITEYADRLLDNLKKLDWSEKVKIAQKDWIGKSEGAEILFQLKTNPLINLRLSRVKPRGKNQKLKAYIKVFTTRPDTLFGATYMVLAPEHELLRQLADQNQVSNWKEIEAYIKKSKRKSDLQRTMLAEAPTFAKGEVGAPTASRVGEKTGVEIKGVKAINPVNKKEIPIFVADYVLSSYGTGAIMAVPAHDKRDFEFATKFKLPIIEVINPIGASRYGSEKFQCYEGEGVLVNSKKFDGMNSKKAKWEIIKFVKGKKKNHYHLRDWLISRQRYWGAPIPMIYCEACAKNKKGERKEMSGWYAVPENQLPVKLPFVKNFRPKGKGVSPLALLKSFYEVKCPGCGAKARRETDVSDTFLDSAWYYLRYIDVKNKNQPFDKLRARKWLPVNMYIGGVEHSVLHLLYSRFLSMVFCDWKLTYFEEPFTKFRAHGLLIKEGAKMSKSKGNVVNPDEYIKKFGADTLRMYLMFLAPFEQGGDFKDSGILGISRFLKRVWRFHNNTKLGMDANTINKELIITFNKTIKKVTEDIENLQYNTAISSLMILLNEMEKSNEQFSTSHLEIFLKLLAPFAPFISEELWEGLGHKNSIHKEKWPQYDQKLIKEEKFELVIQINGKVRDKVLVKSDISQKEAEEIVFHREKINKFIAGQKIKKIIFVPNRLINIVMDFL